MENFEGTYAPQSPDLSGFQSYDEPEPEPFNLPYSPPPQPSNQQSSFYNQQNLYQTAHNQQPFDPFAPDPSIPTSYGFPQQPMPTLPKARKGKMQPDDEEFNPGQPQPKQGRQSKKRKVEEEICDTKAPGADEGVDVKTKFPVARIKRIMQADEDVGKVSQVTPTAVSKALELFIVSLTLKSAAVARSKSSKRVTAAHLKQAVVGDAQMDFLETIVSKVPDAPTTSKSEGKKKGNATEEEESSDEAYVEPKGKKKGVGTRKRKSKGNDD